jgi:hypothetical protein
MLTETLVAKGWTVEQLAERGRCRDVVGRRRGVDDENKKKSFGD